MLLKARVETNHIIQVSHNILGIQHLQDVFNCLEHYTQSILRSLNRRRSFRTALHLYEFITDHFVLLVLHLHIKWGYVSMVTGGFGLL